MSMSESLLAAAEALMNEEFNGGVVEAPGQLEVELGGGAPEVPDTPELTIDAQGRAHGPDGKFVAPSDDSVEEEVPTDVGIEPEAEEEEPEAPAESEPEAQASDDFIELELDEEVEAYLNKYDGDLNKALKAATEAQKLIGRQGNEVGETRQENEALRAVVEHLANLEARLPFSYQNDIDENPQALVGEVLQRASATGQFDEQTYEAALEAWAVEEPFAAARLDAQVAMARQMVESQVPGPAQAVDPSAGLREAVDAFKQRHTDLPQVLPVMNELAESRPVLQRALYEGNATERAQALEDLYTIAKSRTVASDTSAATKKVILRAAAEANKAKADAAVVGASRTSAVKTEEPTGDRLLERALRELSGLDDLVIEG